MGNSGGTEQPQRLKKHSVMIAGHATSVSLEEAFWQALKRMAAARGTSMNRLIAEVDAARGGNLSSALRIHVLTWLEARETLGDK